MIHSPLPRWALGGGATIYIYGCFQKTNGTTKSSIFIGFSNIINYIYKPSILGYPLFLETSIYINKAKIFAGQFDSNVGQLVRYMPNDVALNLLAAGCYKWVLWLHPCQNQTSWISKARSPVWIRQCAIYVDVPAHYDHLTQRKVWTRRDMW